MASARTANDTTASGFVAADFMSAKTGLRMNQDAGTSVFPEREENLESTAHWGYGGKFIRRVKPRKRGSERKGSLMGMTLIHQSMASRSS